MEYSLERIPLEVSEKLSSSNFLVEEVNEDCQYYYYEHGSSTKLLCRIFKISSEEKKFSVQIQSRQKHDFNDELIEIIQSSFSSTILFEENSKLEIEMHFFIVESESHIWSVVSHLINLGSFVCIKEGVNMKDSMTSSVIVENNEGVLVFLNEKHVSEDSIKARMLITYSNHNGEILYLRMLGLFKYPFDEVMKRNITCCKRMFEKLKKKLV